MIFKRYQYWSSKGLAWTDWFKWDSDYKPELQMDDRRIFCRLKNEYKVVSDQPSGRKFLGDISNSKPIGD